MADSENRQLLTVSPLLFVTDIVRAAEYYRDRLGFRFEHYWGDPPSFVMVYRDGVQFMLAGGNEGGKPQPNQALDGHSWDAYVYVRDADKLHDELSANGADIVWPPTDQVYGCRDFAAADPDGHLLCFGHDLEP